MMRLALVAALLLLPLSACSKQGKQAALPPPQEISASSTAQFCGMLLSEHSGPKGQIFVRGNPQPLWFASVRDTLAFTLMPETPKDIAAIYVSDMGRAKNWDQPERGAWIEAHRALYVIGSRARSGMNADETVPFGDADAARRFAVENGGRVVAFADIPQSFVLSSNGDGS